MQWWTVRQVIKDKLWLSNVLRQLMENKEMAGTKAQRAPLASEESESSLQLAGTEVEITRGKEFKVSEAIVICFVRVNIWFQIYYFNCLISFN
jgi:hypothetical protein